MKEIKSIRHYFKIQEADRFQWSTLPDLNIYVILTLWAEN